MEEFQSLNDDELLAEFRSGELTDLAKSVAREELQRRGIDISEEIIEPPTGDAGPSADDKLVCIARSFSAAEAEILRGRLEVEGVPALVADAHTVRAMPFMAIAGGGVRVLVPESYADRALEIVKGVEKGDYALRGIADD